jgi:predicted outer membrane repeat protein
VVSSAPDFVECVRCRFQGNSCGTSGGAWSAEGGTVTLIDVVASTNSATVGGALHVGGGADVMLEGGAFTSHTAIDGGSVLDVVFGAVFFDAVDLATPGPDDNASPEVRVPGTTYDLDGTWSGVCDELECA